MKRKLKVYQAILYGISLFILILSIILFTVSDFFVNEFSNLSFEEIIFHLKVPLSGTSMDMIFDYFKYEKILLMIALVFVAGLIGLFVKAKEIRNRKVANVGAMILAFLVCVTSIFSISKNLGVDTYFARQQETSTFISDHYVDPLEVKISCKNKKRNLIYIFMESMETTFLSKGEGGTMQEDLLPNLTLLAKENANFSEDNLVGGACAATGATWTSGAMLAQTSGMPLLLPMNGKTYKKDTSFLPGLTSLGDILEKNGYNQMLMIGSDAAFGGREMYFKQHGNYSIWDYNTAISQKKIPSDYYQWWGFEDEKLYSYAKEQITKMAAEDQPFNFTMLTVDTHHIGGYVCDLCENKYDSQYMNVLSCADHQVGDFVKWIKAQPFYEDTTIVITGDHPSMDKRFIDQYYDNSKPRRVYNCIINSTIETNHTKNRKFTSMDFFPTTLETLGFSVEGNRLGLGTNLFSDEKTLAEKYGYDEINKELSKKSNFYYDKILQE